jgi:RND family efflux transporter MFP subunit
MAKKNKVINSKIKYMPKTNISGFLSLFKSFLTKRNIIIGIVVLLIIFWRINAARNGGIKIETQTVERKTLVESVSASGEVMAEKYANMYLSPGKVAWIGVTEGDTVKKGQALISLDKTLLDSMYQQAQNMVRKYNATVENVYDQLKNKSATETFSERDIRTTAEATNDYYYNALRAAEYNLKNATLFAPFDGIVTAFSQGLSVGANILGATPVFIVVDPNTTYIKAEVGESDVVKIKLGQKVSVELDAYPGETFESKVAVIDFANVITSSGGKAYKVRVALPENKDLKFKLGMSGDAEFIVSEKESVLLISQGAVMEDGDKNYVWIVKDEKASKKEVSVGGSSIDDVEITSGLSEGDKVIVNPPANIKEGSKVK